MNPNTTLSKISFLILILLLLQNSFIIYKICSLNQCQANSRQDDNTINQAIPSEKIKEPETPEEIYEAFKKYVFEKKFDDLKKIIHTDGVYYFDNERIALADINYSKFAKSNCYSILVNGLKKGKESISDNFSSAQGGRASHIDNPDFDIQQNQENDGFFRRGSKIIAVYYRNDGNNSHEQMQGTEAIVIQLKKDKGKWKIYSIYNWIWSIE